MEYRTLGNTQLQVSALCLGTMQFGWTADEALSFRVLNAAVEAGINFIDTADIYSRWAEGNPGGVSEQIIGRWWKQSGVKREALVLATPRGKVIGGSSSINGMVYVRGHPLDFDHWQSEGARGWAYEDVLPYFIRMESTEGGEPGWRGTDGPLHVTRGKLANPLYRAFIEAGRQAGYPVTKDYNGRRQEGFGPMEQTVWMGRRWSTTYSRWIGLSSR